VSAPATQAEPLLDLQRLAAGIRWRRRTWLTLGLVGLIIGGIAAVVLPHPTAVTRILVVRENEDAGSGEALIKTDVALFQSTPIAAAALKAVGSNDRPEQLLDSTTVTGLTGNVLEVTVPGKTDADAVARAQALADAFIADHVKRTQDQDQAQVQVLNDRRSAAQDQLDDVNKQIGAAGGANGPDAAAKLEALYARRASLTSQVQALGQQAEEAGVGAPQVQAGTRIVDPPRALRHSLLTTGALDAGLGLLLGLGVGIALCAVATVSRDRPVLRRDIAANLGASVIAQVPAPRRGLLRRRRRMEPEVQRVAGTVARLAREAPRGVSFLSLGAIGTAAEIAVRVADEIAPGRSVEVVDGLPDGALGPVVERLGSSVPVVDGSAKAPAGGIRLGVGSLEPGTAWTDIPWLGPESVLVVRAGHAATSWLHTAARQLADGSVHVIGVVLVHPDPRDRSDGTLWSGLHMALRGRQPEPVAPVARVASAAPLASVVSAVASAAPATPVAPVAPSTPAPPPAPVDVPAQIKLPARVKLPAEGPPIVPTGPATPLTPRPKAPHPEPAAGGARRPAPDVDGPTVRASVAARAWAGSRAARTATVDGPTVRTGAVAPDATGSKPKSEPEPEPAAEPVSGPEPEAAAAADPRPDETPDPPADGPVDPNATVQLQPVRRPAPGETVEVPQ
jgi:hypothetical protein